MISIFIQLDDFIKKFVCQDFSVLSDPNAETIHRSYPVFMHFYCLVKLIDVNRWSSVGQNISSFKPFLISQCSASNSVGDMVYFVCFSL